jgi:hypothetical protein
VAGDPDLYGSIGGRHFEIEVKRADGKLSVLQEKRLAEWNSSGTLTGVARSTADALKILGLNVD